ncbi:MAG: tetratricopeptide repeat protein [Bacteroidales bacterium]|jgi:tetratricopeptide (TPR) repeat protein|nr:tetratricopeptide repeat protein [Bacteroidales bacterium]
MIRFKSIFLLLFVALPVLCRASDADSALNRAERLYRQNEFTAAIEQYRKLTDDGWTSAGLLYNMGNACFKNHDIKSAILYYERARRLSPGDEAIDFNLQLSRTLIFDKVEAVPELFLITWGKAVRDLFSVRMWSWLSIWCFILTLSFGLVFLFVRKLGVKRIAFSIGVLCFLMFAGAFTFAGLQKANVERTDEAIVFAPSVTVKSSPDDSGNNLFILHEGVKVHIEDRIDEWCEIRIADGNKGWMRIKDLTVI